MANYTNPPQRRDFDNSFFDNIVGLQVVQGGGLTQGNFTFTTTVSEKSNRSFDTGNFSGPITLNTLDITNTLEAQKIYDVNFKVYPNFDQTDVLRFVAYGPLKKRFSAAVTNIINHFPGAIESTQIRLDYTTGVTAFNIYYDSSEDLTYFSLDVPTLKNPFSVDFTINATRNISLLPYEISKYRNFYSNYTSYILDLNNTNFSLVDITGTTSLSAGTLMVSVRGNAFSGDSFTTDTLIIRPNDFTVNEVFNLELDEVEEILLNRYTFPIYTSKFKVLSESSDGTEFIKLQTLTWPLDGSWNIDIRTPQFTTYIEKLDEIASKFDEYETDLISRFYTTESLQEFDTQDGKVAKTLKLYGRSFDETKKYVDSISHMVSVNYNVGNDVPSKLLINLAATLGWDTKISPIQNNSFLSTLYTSNQSQFPGMANSVSTDELEFQYYRNLLMNSAYLFKSKGTRKAIEFLMSNIGAPEAILEFNEHVYTVGGVFQISRFNQLYDTISGGTFISSLPVLDPTFTYRFNGAPYTGYSVSTSSVDVSITKSDYPVDLLGYPKPPKNNDSMFFQKGEGWFESTPQHRSPEIITSVKTVETGSTVDVQTTLEPFSYGEKYLNRFTNFPYFGTGFGLLKNIDNKKSWHDNQNILRKNSAGNYDSYYKVSEDKLVLNVKNVDIFLNPAQALSYDVWYLSSTQDYPIPYNGLTPTFVAGDVDQTIVDPKPQVKDFFEFKESFWRNMINVRNRQNSSDGKTGGYPRLQGVFYNYLESLANANVQNDGFSYSKMIDYINGIGTSWIRLVEQFVPATTLLNAGFRIENSIFHRQKFVYRWQRGCLPLEVELRGPQAFGGFVSNDCNTTNVTIDVTYNSNQLQSEIGTLLSNANCPKNNAYIQSLSYGFEIIIVRGNDTYTLTYSNPEVYIFPTYIIKSGAWVDFIQQGIGYITSQLIELGITATYENNIITLQSQDCIQINSADFNLSYINVTFGCL
jgi:hypothetical protein